MSDKIELVADVNNQCGEAPTWDPSASRVVWTDNESDEVYQFAADSGETSVLSKGRPVAAIALNRKGGFVFGGLGGHADPHCREKQHGQY